MRVIKKAGQHRLLSTEYHQTVIFDYRWSEWLIRNGLR